MVIKRYLVHFAYIGTKYRGVQKQGISNLPEDGIPIQNVIEDALRDLRPVNDIHTSLSSRTDKRVHALCNTLHLDLEHPIPNQTYQPQVITAVVNEALRRRDHDIKILKTQMVPQEFHARFSVISRTYKYRVLVISGPNGENSINGVHSEVALFEKYRSLPVVAPLNLDKMLEAMELFKGVHDLASFTTKLGTSQVITTLRDINQFEIHPAGGMMQYENIDMWDFVVKSRSFLYHQVIRMVGAVLSVGKGFITLDDIRYMLDNPNSENWNHNLFKPRPDALYLAKVEYDPKDLEFGTNYESVTNDRQCEDDGNDVN